MHGASARRARMAGDGGQWRAFRGVIPRHCETVGRAKSSKSPTLPVFSGQGPAVCPSVNAHKILTHSRPVAGVKSLTDSHTIVIVYVVGRATAGSVRWSKGQPAPFAMHIMYLDESGTHSQARYFVVAGLAVFERETYFLAQSLDQLQARYFPHEDTPIPLHASALRAPVDRVVSAYVSITGEQRRALARDIYQVIADSRARLFAIAMEKAFLTGDPYERGFEEIVNRFDRMLARIGRDGGDSQRGLVVIAESSYRENLETLARKIWSQGHRWGETHNLADTHTLLPPRAHDCYNWQISFQMLCSVDTRQVTLGTSIILCPALTNRTGDFTGWSTLTVIVSSAIAPPASRDERTRVPRLNDTGNFKLTHSPLTLIRAVPLDGRHPRSSPAYPLSSARSRDSR